MSVLKPLVGRRRPAQAKDIELIVLRHELKASAAMFRVQDCA